MFDFLRVCSVNIKTNSSIIFYFYNIAFFRPRVLFIKIEKHDKNKGCYNKECVHFYDMSVISIITTYLMRAIFRMITK